MPRRSCSRRLPRDRALAAGIPPSDVARFGGTSLTMLERVYAHLLESSAEAARQRLDAFHANAAEAAQEGGATQ
jgi:hypothetical protein